jgi:hypothetical protein
MEHAEKERKLGPILVEDTKNSWSWKSLYVQCGSNVSKKGIVPPIL